LVRAGPLNFLGISSKKIEPPARKHGEHVEFEFDPNDTPAQNIEKVLAAIASGQLTLEAGSLIINGIEKLAIARATETELIAAFKDMADKLPV
jgi:hypothetical protein